MRKQTQLTALCGMLFFLFSFQLIGQTTDRDTAGNTPIIFIMDASGSMWGKVDEQYKIEIARTVMGDLLKDFDNEKAIGMVAYGHRRKGDCDDVEYLVETKKGSKQMVLDQLNAIKPLGKTPLARSAELVIDGLRKSKTPSTVILLTDGIETCDGDLCEIVRQAKADGIEFVMHIVGFDLGKEDKQALECAALASDGQYLDASNAEELGSALNQVTELTVENLTFTLAVTTTKDSSLQDAMVNVYPAGSEEPLFGRRTYSSASTNPAKFAAPAGKYDIIATHTGKNGIASVKLENVNVPGDSLVSKLVDFSAGTISILSTSNGELWDSSVKIINRADGSSQASGRTYTSSSSNPFVMELSPGTYNVELGALAMQGAAASKTFNEIVIEPGKTVELAHDFGKAKLSVLSTINGDLGDAMVNVYLSGSKTGVASGRTYTSSSSNPRTFDITPGTYDVKLMIIKMNGEGKEKVFENVELTADKLTELKHDFEAGELIVGARQGSTLLDATVNIVDKGTGKSVDGSRTYTSESSNPRTYLLSPGTYEVTVKAIKLKGAMKKFTATVTKKDRVTKWAEY